MTREEAKHKLDFLKKSYQKLIDEKVDSGKLVGDGVRGEWKAKTPLDEVYKNMVEALDMTIKALEQQPKIGHWEWVRYDSNPNIGNWHCSECNRIVCGAIKNAANPIFYAYKYCPNCGARMAESEEA